MFFETIYRWFMRLFGSPLAEKLSGYDSATEEMQGANQFFPIGIITLVITLAVLLFYYYVLNHPRFNRWWSWLISLIFAGLINLAYGIATTAKYASEGNIGDADLVYISESVGFGFANLIVSTLWFIVFSLLFKWWSRNCKYSPF
jgi:phosphatidylglycerophosphatase A